MLGLVILQTSLNEKTNTYKSRDVTNRTRDERTARDEENLRRALKKRDLDGGGPRLEWKERRDDERRWRWRIGMSV
ncbi:hypothetical protein TNCV_5104561 [Trichonephila clavipes]|nr:hypothetical protein TNCV_5104561 [Trichonephila clavipes]